MEGGKGSDIFICDMFDKILDFDSQEGDSTLENVNLMINQLLIVIQRTRLPFHLS